jgi:hypothetical protein
MDQVTVYAAAATSSAKRHLEDDHNILEKDKRFILLNKQNQAASEDSPIIRSFSRQSDQTSAVAWIGKRSIEEFRWLFLQWIICCHIALAMVGNPFFPRTY